MVALAAAEDIGGEVEYLSFVHRREQHRRHRRDFRSFDALHLFAIHGDALIGIGQVGVDRHGVSVEIDDGADDGVAVVLGQHGRHELFVDFFTRVNDLVEEVPRTVATAGAREVGSGHAAFVAEAVTGEAGSGAKHFAAIVEVAAFHPAISRRGEFIERPILEGAPGENIAEIFDRAAPGRFLVEDCGERGALLGREGGDGVVANELDELGKARATAEIGGLQKPLEIGGAGGGRPARGEHAQRTGVFDLFFLGGGGGDQRHGLRCDRRRAQIDERFAKQPIEFGRAGGKQRVEFRQQGGGVFAG